MSEHELNSALDLSRDQAIDIDVAFSAPVTPLVQDEPNNRRLVVSAELLQNRRQGCQVANVAVNAHKLSSDLLALSRLGLPDRKTQLKLDFSQLVIVNVLLCLSQKFEKHLRREVVRLIHDPLAVLRQHRHKEFVHQNLKTYLSFF